MALETGTYISDLVSTNPVGTDTLDKADDHLRLIKSTIKATFPNITGVTDIYASGTGGNVGIGAGMPNSKFVVSSSSGSAPSNTTGNCVARFQSTQAAAVGVGPSVLFEGQTNNTTSNYAFAGIQGFKASATASDYSGSLAFFTQNPGGGAALTEAMRIDSSGNVGIGVTTVSDKLHVGGATSTYMRVTSTNAGTGAGIRFTNATGQWLIGAGPQSGLADFQFYDGNAASERLKIDSSGNVLVTGPGGLGYGTGSGGSVTQLTSKATTVTLNKTNGKITMNAAALASGTPALFALSNTTIAATDTIIVHPTYAAVLYRAWVYAVSAGACSIAVQQDSGSSQSDAVTLNFSVIKAVTA